MLIESDIDDLRKWGSRELESKLAERFRRVNHSPQQATEGSPCVQKEPLDTPPMDVFQKALALTLTLEVLLTCRPP
jgi:hypothetical protein